MPPSGAEEIIETSVIKELYATVPHGEMYASAGSTTYNLADLEIQIFDAWDAEGSSFDVEPNIVTGKLIINTKGRYLVNVSMAFESTGSVLWLIGIMEGGVVGGTIQSNLTVRRQMGAGGDVGVISISGICACAPGDELSVIFFQNAGLPNKDITVKDINFTISRIGN